MSEPLRVRVCKAEPFPGDTVRGAIIEITREQDAYNYRDDLAVIDAQFAADAEAIEDGLHNSLPGGTYDRLCGLLLARKATHFRVPHMIREAIECAT